MTRVWLELYMLSALWQACEIGSGALISDRDRLECLFDIHNVSTKSSI